MDFKRSLLAFLMMFQSVALFSNNRIFFHNNYNGSIAVQVNDRPEVIVPYNTRVFLGTIRLDSRVPLALVKSIKIRATGGVWSAYDRTPYTLLDKNLLDIQWQKKLHLRRPLPAAG